MSDFIKKIFGLLGGNKSPEDQSGIKASEKPAATTPESGPANGKNPEHTKSIKAAKKPAVAAKTRKRSGYFMELDETEDVKAVNGNQPPKEVTAAKTPEPVAVEPTSSKPAKTAPAKTAETVKNVPAPKIELVQTAEGVKAELAKPVSSSAGNTNGQKPTETTFAPKYLAPTTTSKRRRPGPNMNTFLDMARQVKSPD